MIRKRTTLANLLRIKEKKGYQIIDSIRSLHPGLSLYSDKMIIKISIKLLGRLLMFCKFMNKANIAVQVKDINGSNQFIYTSQEVKNRAYRLQNMLNSLNHIKQFKKKCKKN